MTRQKLTAILKRGGLQASKWHASGRVRGWGRSSEGYRLKVVETNERYAQTGPPHRPRWIKVGSDVVGFELEYVTRDSIMLSSERRAEAKAAGLARIRAALSAANVSFEEKGDTLVVAA